MMVYKNGIMISLPIPKPIPFEKAGSVQETDAPLTPPTPSAVDTTTTTKKQEAIDAKIKSLKKEMERLQNLNRVQQNRVVEKIKVVKPSPPPPVFDGEMKMKQEPQWMNKVMAKPTLGGAMTITCVKCGQDHITSQHTAQHDSKNRMCIDCWKKEKQNILDLSSVTGSKKKTKKTVKRVVKRKAVDPTTPTKKKQRPDSPEPTVKRTITPPVPKKRVSKTKYQVNIFHV